LYFEEVSVDADPGHWCVIEEINDNTIKIGAKVRIQFENNEWYNGEVSSCTKTWLSDGAIDSTWVVTYEDGELEEYFDVVVRAGISDYNDAQKNPLCSK
jgi:hypothetical protein